MPLRTTDFLSLPVYRHRALIVDALEKNQVIVVESPTGSGKTTQIPLILREAGYDKYGIIGITQPRRIATLSICEFIKEQIHDEGSYAAYTMRFNDTSTDQTRIKIMTDGILLQEAKDDRLLSKYSVMMIDEAHERSLNIDFILGLLKEIITLRKDLKIIISSATINTSVFSRFFDNAPIISIDGNPFPVEVRYRAPKIDKNSPLLPEEQYYQEIVRLVESAHKDPNGGDVLIFLPGEGEIKDTLNALYTSPIKKELQIYPLFGRLSKEEQEEVFTPTESGKTKVVVATNIAETSLTIDGIRTVIDSGNAKINFYNQHNFTSALIPMPISKASADQRKGRAGRTASGVCYRLYSELSFDRRPEYNEEEILHSDLAEVVLRMSELEIYNTDTFPFITRPKGGALKSAEETLILIGAIEKNHHLTEIGKMMIKFPLLPRLSRVIVEAILNYPRSIRDVITAVAFLSTKSPFVLPPGEELKARDAHRALSDREDGDFITFLTLYKRYTSMDSAEERADFTKSHYLDFQTMEEIVHIKGQIEDIISKDGIPLLEGAPKKEYFSCLTSGLRQYICKKIDRVTFRTVTADRIMIHPGSAWFKRVPTYILAGEIVQTSKLFARTVSPLKEEWIAEIDPNILKALSKNKTKRAETSKVGLDTYKTTLKGNKDTFLVPLQEAERVKNRSNTKIYLSIGKYISAQPIPTYMIDKELTLVMRVKRPIERRAKDSFRLNKSAYPMLFDFIDKAFTPILIGQNEFGYLEIKESKGKFTLLSTSKLTTAINETLYSLSVILDMIPKKETKVRKSLENTIINIEKAMDLSED